MKVEFKKTVPEAVTPTKAHKEDAGFDLTAVSVIYDVEQRFYEYDTGISVFVPPGFVGLLASRSSSSKTGLHLCNGIGVVDSGYVGSIKARFYEKTIPGYRNTRYEVGDKIAQLVIMPIPEIELEEVKELKTTKRGSGGFGSTGR